MADTQNENRPNSLSVKDGMPADHLEVVDKNGGDSEKPHQEARLEEDAPRDERVTAKAWVSVFVSASLSLPLNAAN